MTNFDRHLNNQLKVSEFRKEYEALAPQYEVIKQIIIIYNFY